MPSLHILTIPLLLTLSFPLTLIAILTTCFAATILTLRVALIYLELALVILPSYLPSFSSPSTALSTLASSPKTLSARSRRQSDAKTPGTSPHRIRRSRRLSTSSLNIKSQLRTSSSAISLPAQPSAQPPLSLHLSSQNPARDFEGVGGWRLEKDPDSESGESWTKINSRLTLPNTMPSSPIKLRHQRSASMKSLFLTGMMGGQGEGGEGSWSPNMKRVRTPRGGGKGLGIGWSFGGEREREREGYFPVVDGKGSLGGTGGGSVTSSPESGD